MSISFAYELDGVGWAKCTIAIDGQHATITASYLSDALADLLGAVTRMVEGLPDATASFTEEPGEYRWRLFHIEHDQLRIRILSFPELWGNQSDEEGEVIFEAQCRLRTFAGVVLSESQRLLEKHGRGGYRDTWRQHFPFRKQAELRQALREVST